MSMEGSTNSIFSACLGISSPGLSGLRRQLRHPQQIIRSPYPPRRQLRSCGSPKTRFPKSSHCLYPTKNLFHPLSDPLAYTVAWVPCGSPIDGRSPSALGVGRQVRKNLSAPQKTDKVLGVITLIGSQSFDLDSFLPLTLKLNVLTFNLTDMIESSLS
jgi:hypothetical protein